MSSIVVEAGNPIYDSRNNCNAIIKTSNNKFLIGCKNSIIPNTVTIIGDNAFSDCTELTSVNIPNSVTYIGDAVFSGCSGLTSVSIPNSVTTIWEFVFEGCSSLKSAIIGNGVTSIPKYTFRGCSSLTNVTIGNSITSIESGAFYGCSAMTSISMPSSLTSIGDSAFEGCCALTKISIPGSVMVIGEGAFDGTAMYNSQLQGHPCPIYIDKVLYKYIGKIPKNTHLDIVEGTLGIADNAFFGYDCSGLVSVNIPNTVTSIGSEAFRDCSGLTSISIPNSVKRIGTYAFRNCSGLANITIGNSVAIIGSSAFDNTAWYNNQSNGLIYAGRVLYTYKGTIPNNTNIAIEEGTLGIADNAFYKSFGESSGLTSVIIPQSLIHIGSYAFRYCSGLTSITIPSSVTNIGYGTFSDCMRLTSVTVDIAKPLRIYEGTFLNRTNATLYIPKGSKAAYETADYWKEFKEIIEFEPEIEVTDVTEIDDAIYIDPFSAPIGGDVNMAICLKNAQAATAYNFDLVMPEGVTIAKGSNGKYIEGLSKRHNDHTPTLNYKSENTYSFASLSGNSEALTGNDGAIRLVTLHVDDDVAEGTYAIEIKNASYSQPNGTEIVLPNTVTSITAESYVLGDVNGNSHVDIGDAVSIVNYLVGKPSTTFVEKAADTNKNGHVDIGDAVTIVNFLVGKTVRLSRSMGSVMDVNEPQ